MLVTKISKQNFYFNHQKSLKGKRNFSTFALIFKKLEVGRITPNLMATRGMKKVVLGKTLPAKTFVNAFVSLRSLGASSNQVELVARNQLEDFTFKKTGLLLRLYKPKTWPTMNSNQQKGFFGEELQKEINLGMARIHGYHIEQTPSGLHPSAGKGPDISKTVEKFLGLSSDQGDIELGVETTVEEVKTTTGKLTQGSGGGLDRLVGKNKAIQQMNEQKGEHYEQAKKIHANSVSEIVDENLGTPVVKNLQTKAIGLTPEPTTSDKQGSMNTHSQELYETSKQVLEDFRLAFTDPGKSEYAQIEYPTDD